MKLKSLLSVALIGLSGTAMAQSWTYDSVAMGAGYANNVFYELKYGSTSIKAGNEWDLGFQMSPADARDPNFNACVRANHAKKQIEVYSLHLQASTRFGNLTPADTVGKTNTASQLFNDESNWGKGAFYQNHLVTDAFCYGWGKYSLSNHNIVGDSVYLVKVAGAAYQMWIQQYVSNPTDSVSYLFRIAKLDGSNSNTVKIYRKSATADFSKRLFAYYDIASNTIVNHEPSPINTWDLMFTQYVAMVQGPSGIQPYPVTGVLTNLGTEVADIRHTNPDDVTSTNYKSYVGLYNTSRTDEIGSDWKTFNQTTFQYSMDDSGSFIVKSKNTLEYWQIQFTRFDGGGAGGGKIVFRKRLLGDAVSVPKIAAQALNAWAVSPNPTAAEATLMLDAKKAVSAQLIVTDMAGRTVQASALDLKSGVNAFHLNTAAWPAGMYAVQVATADWKVSSRLSVVH